MNCNSNTEPKKRIFDENFINESSLFSIIRNENRIEIVKIPNYTFYAQHVTKPVQFGKPGFINWLYLNKKELFSMKILGIYEEIVKELITIVSISKIFKTINNSYEKYYNFKFYLRIYSLNIDDLEIYKNMINFEYIMLKNPWKNKKIYILRVLLNRYLPDYNMMSIIDTLPIEELSNYNLLLNSDINYIKDYKEKDILEYNENNINNSYVKSTIFYVDEEFLYSDEYVLGKNFLQNDIPRMFDLNNTSYKNMHCISEDNKLIYKKNVKVSVYEMFYIVDLMMYFLIENIDMCKIWIREEDNKKYCMICNKELRGSYYEKINHILYEFGIRKSCRFCDRYDSIILNTVGFSYKHLNNVCEYENDDSKCKNYSKIIKIGNKHFNLDKSMKFITNIIRKGFIDDNDINYISEIREGEYYCNRVLLEPLECMLREKTKEEIKMHILEEYNLLCYCKKCDITYSLFKSKHITNNKFGKYIQRYLLLKDKWLSISKNIKNSNIKNSNILDVIEKIFRLSEITTLIRPQRKMNYNEYNNYIKKSIKIEFDFIKDKQKLDNNDIENLKTLFEQAIDSRYDNLNEIYEFCLKHNIDINEIKLNKYSGKLKKD